MASGIFRVVSILLDKISARKFEEDAEKALGAAGDAGGKAMIRALKNSFNLQMASLREQLAKGLIDEKEFKKRSDAAGEAFNSGILKSIQKLRAEGKLTDTQFISLGKSLKKTGDDGVSMATLFSGALVKLGAVIATTFAVSRIIAFGRDSVAQAIDAQNAWALLSNQLHDVGLNADREIPKLRMLGQEFQRSSRFDNDAFAKGITTSLQITGDYARTLRLVSLGSDVAVAKQITFSQGMEIVSKISNGATKELKEFGIKTDDAEKGLQKLSKELRGTTAADLDTVAGKSARLRNEWDDLKKSFGEALIGGDTPSKIDQTRDAIQKLTPIAEALGVAFRGAFIGVAGFFDSATKWVASNVWARLGVGRGPATPAEAADRDADIRIAMMQHAMSPQGLNKLADPNSPEAIEARKAAAEKLKQKLDEEVSILQKGHDLRILTTSDIGHALALEQRYSAELLSGNGTLKARQQIAERLKTLREIIAQPAIGLAGTGVSPFSAKSAGIPAQVGPHLVNGEVTTSPDVRGNIFIDQTVPEALPGLLNGMPAPEPMGARYTKVLGIIEDNANDTARALADVGFALASGGVKSIHELAKAKVKENLAWSIEEGALALGALFFNPVEAKAHEHSAETHLAAMVAWAALAGATGGGGGGGGSAGGGAAGGSGGGSGGSSAGSQPAQQVNIYVDPFDKNNPVHQDVAGEAAFLYAEREGLLVGSKFTLHVGKR